MVFPTRYGTLGEKVFGKDDPFNNDINSHMVIDDSIPVLEHPVTGEKVNSKTRWAQINKEHKLDVVGNDVPKYRHRIPDKFTDELVLDRIQKAESIVGDSSKLQEFYNRNEERLERRRLLIER